MGIIFLTVLITVTNAREPRKQRPKEIASPLDEKSLKAIEMEVEQTPADDRDWKVRPKPKADKGKKIHIYLDGTKPGGQDKPQRKQQKPKGKAPEKEREVETQTSKTPELTTRSDRELNPEWAGDSVAEGATFQEHIHHPSDEGHEHVVKEKVKIKHHHHHHHHNHVKTIVKKVCSQSIVFLN